MRNAEELAWKADEFICMLVPQHSFRLSEMKRTGEREKKIKNPSLSNCCSNPHKPHTCYAPSVDPKGKAVTSFPHPLPQHSANCSSSSPQRSVPKTLHPSLSLRARSLPLLLLPPFPKLGPFLFLPPFLPPRLPTTAANPRPALEPHHIWRCWKETRVNANTHTHTHPHTES